MVVERDKNKVEFRFGKTDLVAPKERYILVLVVLVVAPLE